MKNMIYCGISCIILCTLLISCSSKDPILGERESIILSSDLDEKLVFDKSQVVIDPSKENSEFLQSFMNSNKTYNPIKFSFPSKKIWSVKLGYESGDSLKITSAPVVADGKVFCMDAGGGVYAINQKTGEKIWKISTTLTGKDGQVGGALAYDNGRLIVSSSFSECFLIDAQTGKIIWRIKLPAPCKGDGITVYDGKAFLSCSNSSLQVIDIGSGKTIWSHTGMLVEASYIGSAGVAVGNGLVFVAYPSGEIYALLLVNGEQVWDAMFSHTSLTNAARAFSHPRACPVLKDNIVYFSSASGQTCAFEATTGNKLWSCNYGSVQTPIVSGNSMFIFSGKSELVCLNIQTGITRWIISLDKKNTDIRDWYGQILIDDGLAMLSPNGKLSLVSVYDGIIKKTEYLALSGGVSLNPVISNSMMYILSDDAELSAYK